MGLLRTFIVLTTAIYRELWTIVKAQYALAEQRYGCIYERAREGTERFMIKGDLTSYDVKRCFVERDLSENNIDPREFRCFKLVWKKIINILIGTRSSIKESVICVFKEK